MFTIETVKYDSYPLQKKLTFSEIKECFNLIIKCFIFEK